VDVAVGATLELTVTLSAGKYVLLCNIYDETEKESHYKMGMRTPFTVTEYQELRTSCAAAQRRARSSSDARSC